MAGRPSNKQRNRRQKVKARYTKAREDAQLEGIIPTSPEGAVRDERVDPASQSVRKNVEGNNRPSIAVRAAFNYLTAGYRS